MGQQPAGRWPGRANQNGRQLVHEAALVLFDVDLRRTRQKKSNMDKRREMSSLGLRTVSHPVCGWEELLQVVQPLKDKLRPLMLAQLSAHLLVEQEAVSSLHPDV